MVITVGAMIGAGKSSLAKLIGEIIGKAERVSAVQPAVVGITTTVCLM